MSDHEGEETAAAFIGTHEPTSAARGGVTRPLPLNSKRLTAVLLKRHLELPLTASADETRLLIEGKLEELGHAPRNVQVVLEDATLGTHIRLQDYEGVFLDLEPEEVDTDPHPSLRLLGKPMGLRCSRWPSKKQTVSEMNSSLRSLVFRQPWQQRGSGQKNCGE